MSSEKCATCEKSRDMSELYVCLAEECLDSTRSPNTMMSNFQPTRLCANCILRRGHRLHEIVCCDELASQAELDSFEAEGTKFIAKFEKAYYQKGSGVQKGYEPDMKSFIRQSLLEMMTDDLNTNAIGEALESQAKRGIILKSTMHEAQQHLSHCDQKITKLCSEAVEEKLQRLESNLKEELRRFNKDLDSLDA